MWTELDERDRVAVGIGGRGQPVVLVPGGELSEGDAPVGQFDAVASGWSTAKVSNVLPARSWPAYGFVPQQNTASARP
jgi:hypothetical protein